MTATISQTAGQLLLTPREAAATLAISERHLWGLTKGRHNSSDPTWPRRFSYRRTGLHRGSPKSKRKSSHP